MMYMMYLFQSQIMIQRLIQLFNVYYIEDQQLVCL